MAPPNPLIFDSRLSEIIEASKILVVGAGGIGCELLKNLILTGFQYIEVIDLDTIEVSNLNRQFLFHKQHVGKSKAEVARESVLQFNPEATVVAHHDSITSSKFDINFFAQFSIVLSALDNARARSHLSRLCLASGVPLVESGTSGFDGQVELIYKNFTKCYDCSSEKDVEKDYPSCTIRNTPSQLIHCIIWGKYLFHQLFTAITAEDDYDVSPDPTDLPSGEEGAVKPAQTTTDWVKKADYAPEKILNKLFIDDINWLLAMKHLWLERTPPSPLKWQQYVDEDFNKDKLKELTSLTRKAPWTLKESVNIFIATATELREAMKSSGEGFLVWDKDDKTAMSFVAAAACIRAEIFGIETNTLFEIKSMAGRIVPAVATSNAMVAGLIVFHALNVLRDAKEECRSVYIRSIPAFKGSIITRESVIVPPNPGCWVCADKPKVIVATDLSKMKIRELEKDVLKEKLHMIAPDVQMSTTGNVIISSDETETEGISDKALVDMGIYDGTILHADDYHQNFKISIIMLNRELARDDPPFFIISDISTLKPQEAEMKPANGEEGPEHNSDDEYCAIIDGDEETVCVSESRKRKLDESNAPLKKRKREDNTGEDSVEDEIIEID